MTHVFIVNYSHMTGFFCVENGHISREQRVLPAAVVLVLVLALLTFPITSVLGGHSLIGAFKDGGQAVAGS